jgi:hypothetical protein
VVPRRRVVDSATGPLRALFDGLSFVRRYLNNPKLEDYAKWFGISKVLETIRAVVSSFPISSQTNFILQRQQGGL